MQSKEEKAVVVRDSVFSVEMRTIVDPVNNFELCRRPHTGSRKDSSSNEAEKAKLC